MDTAPLRDGELLPPLSATTTTTATNAATTMATTAATGHNLVLDGISLFGSNGIGGAGDAGLGTADLGCAVGVLGLDRTSGTAGGASAAATGDFSRCSGFLVVLGFFDCVAEDVGPGLG